MGFSYAFHIKTFYFLSENKIGNFRINKVILSKSREEILKQLFEEYPDIFENETSESHISLKQLASKLEELKKIDENFPIRLVLFEKIGNITSRKNKFIKLINSLSNHGR